MLCLSFSFHHQTEVSYAKYLSPTRLVSQRDFVNLTNWVVDDDGSVWIAAISIEHPKAPEVSGADHALAWVGSDDAQCQL